MFGCCDNIAIDIDVYLNDFILSTFGNANCENSAGYESDVCNFMSNKENHALFVNGYPVDFEGNVWSWLKERSTLIRMYLNDAGDNWNEKSGWMSSDDHCSWYGIACTETSNVLEINMEGNQLIGPFPTDLSNFNNLANLNTASNVLTGSVPSDVCTRSEAGSLFISGDSLNCPNEFNIETGEFSLGCCDTVTISPDKYLNDFSAAVLGDSNCDNMSGADIDVCNYISTSTNHDIFAQGFPYNFEGNVWHYMTERAALAKLYLTSGGSNWNDQNDWMGTTSHCSWSMIQCSTTNSVTMLDLKSNNLEGIIPDELERLESLEVLNLQDNLLTELIPSGVCSLSSFGTLQLSGDHLICPNANFEVEQGILAVNQGCCSEVSINIDGYLRQFAIDVLGDSNCNNFEEVETDVCNYMINKANHDIFDNGYPFGGFPGIPSNYIWGWLQERSVLVRMYLNDGGNEWANNDGWMSSINHCSWYGISCDPNYSTTEIILDDNELEGPFPNDLVTLSALSTLRLSLNALTGLISNEICTVSHSGNLYISGDNTNCIDYSNTGAGDSYLEGCCDDTMMDVASYLETFTSSVLGDNECDNLVGTEGAVCTFMSNEGNHAIFSNGFPSDFEGDIWSWLVERSILVRMYMNDGGDGWDDNYKWLSPDDHCSWSGIICNEVFSITDINMEDNRLIGPFPTDLGQLGDLTTLNMHYNSLNGTIPDDVCTETVTKEVHIYADAPNCPNEFEASTGLYAAGCCDNLVIDMGEYLKEFAAHVLGDANCVHLVGAEIGVCNYIINVENYDLFSDGYPYEFNGNVWEWINERAVLVRMYLSTGGHNWANNNKWLSSENHCSWHGVTCSSDFSVTVVDLENNGLVGPFPQDVGILSNLDSLNMHFNSLTGLIPNDVCEQTIIDELRIYGDGANCPNDFQSSTGEYLAGCCYNIVIDMDIYLNHFAEAMYGSSDCDSLVDAEVAACHYMKAKDNHELFNLGYPTAFEANVWGWLKERSILAQAYLGTGGQNWVDNIGWLSIDNHCTWAGIKCTPLFNVTNVHFEGNQMVGPFPNNLQNLDYLQELTINANDLTGIIPDELCEKSINVPVFLKGDTTNCPNNFNSDFGEYEVPGCCDEVTVNAEMYLMEFVNYAYGIEGCGSLSGTDADVCSWMSDFTNHGIFANGYPTDFVGSVWSWLWERNILVQMFYNNGGTTWSDNADWLGTTNHCSWRRVSCDDQNSISALSLSNNGMTGPVPTSLETLANMHTLKMEMNSLTGTMPDELCIASTTGGLSYLSGDAANCENSQITGCCDYINLAADAQTYL